MQEELGITKDEAQVFILIVKNGKLDPMKISDLLRMPVFDTQRIANSLVDHGMIIQITESEFEALHPRFAITNKYRRKCNEDGIPLKRNIKIDNMGIALEGYYERARTK
jgi:sugar-specific transcriptional regulator TrmB